MTWFPIGFFPPQFENTSGDPYSGAVLKAYAAGTSTPITMATDYTGATTASSFALNAAGYPVSGGNVIIPHVQQNYKLALYPNQAAADANSGAVWTYDNIQIADLAEDSAVASINNGQVAGFRNGLINGGMDIWQRGTSFTPSAGNITYTADRWVVKRDSAAAYTVSRQTGPEGQPYCMRVQRDSGNASTDNIYLGQSIESKNSYRYQGKKVTLRFKARAGANYSAAGGALSMFINAGTGTDQGIFGYTGATVLASGSCTLTTSWQTFSLTTTAAVGSSITEIGPYFAFTPVGTAGTNDYFEISEVELVEGDVASTYFEKLNFQTVFEQCLRYCEMSFPYGTAPAQNAGLNGSEQFSQSNLTYSNIKPRFKVEKRSTPTITTYNPSAANANVRDSDAGADRTANVDQITSSNFRIYYNSGTASNGNFIHWLATAEV